MKRHIHKNGLALLITMLLMSVLLGISTSLLNVTLKQYQLSGIARASEVAFHAANAGVECLSYHDLTLAVAGVSKFDVPGDGSTAPEVLSISCMDNQVSSDVEPLNNGTIQSGEEQRFEFEWGTPAVCTNVSIYKFHNDSGIEPVVAAGQTFRVGGCPQGSTCTVIRSRGYNTGCANLANPRTVERELTQIY
jgi:hypothetical protein